MQYFKGFILVILVAVGFIGCASSKENWEGNYFYEETADAQSMQFWEYKLEVYREGNELAAHVVVNGFQTAVNLKCNVLVENERAKVIVSKIEEGNLFEAYKVGDVLFELEKNKGSVVTHWVKMLPNVKSSSNEGAYFMRKK